MSDGHGSDVDVDDGREDVAKLRDELVAGGRQAVDAPVEQKHQVLEHFVSDQRDYPLRNRIDDPPNADSALNLADFERFDVGDLALLLEILVENHAQSAQIPLRVLHHTNRPAQPCCPRPTSRRRGDCRTQTPLPDRRIADNKRLAGPERCNSCRPSCLTPCALHRFPSGSSPATCGSGESQPLSEAYFVELSAEQFHISFEFHLFLIVRLRKRRLHFVQKVLLVGAAQAVDAVQERLVEIELVGFQKLDGARLGLTPGQLPNAYQ